MSTNFELDAELRDDKGKGASRRLRKQANKVPAILYGAEKDPVSLSLEHNKVIKAIENEAFFSNILTLNVNGKKEKAVIKDLQRHPFKPQVLHMDFQRVKASEAITMHVPLHFTNEDTSVGVKAGGIVTHLMNEVEIKCLPADLPEYIEVNIAEMNIGDSVHLTQLELPKGVELTAQIADSAHDHPVVSINAKKGGASDEDENANAGDNAEGSNEDKAGS